MKNKKGSNGVHSSNGHAANGHAANGHAANGVGGLEKSKNYRPSDKEPFMNERQREYFRLRLMVWREDILKEAKETLQHLQDEKDRKSVV